MDDKKEGRVEGFEEGGRGIGIGGRRVTELVGHLKSFRIFSYNLPNSDGIPYRFIPFRHWK